MPREAGRAAMEARAFLRAKIASLEARASQLAKLDHASVGIRPQDLPYAPSPRHFQAVNDRLAAIHREVSRSLDNVHRMPATAPPEQVLTGIAKVESEIDRARRTWGLFFEVFSQRGSSFAPGLAAHDVIAADCYAAVIPAIARLYSGPKLRPLTYLDHGFSPVTWRRGVQLSRLLGDANPFPLIRIPWDRDNPWQSVFLHECAHNLQADLGIWQENRAAVVTRILNASRNAALAQTYGRWHKEIFADLTALLLGGPAAAWGLAIFLSHPRERVLSYRPGGAHPTGYIRVLILAEMLRRMGFIGVAGQLARVWRKLYRVGVRERLPALLVSTAAPMIRAVVDEIAFQPRRNLAQHALVDVIPYHQSDEDAIRRAARRLAEGYLPPPDLPPRHIVSAAAYALTLGHAPPRALSQRVIHHLARLNHPAPSHLDVAKAALAA
jgi:hypothetical protein